MIVAGRPVRMPVVADVLVAQPVASAVAPAFVREAVPISMQRMYVPNEDYLVDYVAGLAIPASEALLTSERGDCWRQLFATSNDVPEARAGPWMTIAQLRLWARGNALQSGLFDVVEEDCKLHVSPGTKYRASIILDTYPLDYLVGGEMWADDPPPPADDDFNSELTELIVATCAQAPAEARAVVDDDCLPWGEGLERWGERDGLYRKPFLDRESVLTDEQFISLFSKCSYPWEEAPVLEKPGVSLGLPRVSHLFTLCDRNMAWAGSTALLSDARALVLWAAGRPADRIVQDLTSPAKHAKFLRVVYPALVRMYALPETAGDPTFSVIFNIWYGASAPFVEAYWAWLTWRKGMWPDSLLLDGRYLPVSSNRPGSFADGMCWKILFKTHHSADGFVPTTWMTGAQLGVFRRSNMLVEGNFDLTFVGDAKYHVDYGSMYTADEVLAIVTKRKRLGGQILTAVAGRLAALAESPYLAAPGVAVDEPDEYMPGYCWLRLFEVQSLSRLRTKKPWMTVQELIALSRVIPLAKHHYMLSKLPNGAYHVEYGVLFTAVEVFARLPPLAKIGASVGRATEEASLLHGGVSESAASKYARWFDIFARCCIIWCCGFAFGYVLIAVYVALGGGVAKSS